MSQTPKIFLEQWEFDEAEDNGYVYGRNYGYRIGASAAYAYIELGQEQPYRDNDNDNLLLQYKFFTKCTINYATSYEDLENGKPLQRFISNVILQCNQEASE
jgi:hypothetical protein